MPLFDEEAGVTALLHALGELLEAESDHRDLEFVLVDDGSSDGTWSELQRSTPTDDARWRLVRHDHNRGLTDALRTGTDAARHELVGWLDADLSYDPEVLSRLAEAVDGGADIALASCHHPGGRMEGVPAFRRWLSRMASRLYATATGRPVRTFTCMVRVQRRDLALRTWPERSGFLGVTEQLLRALERGANHVEVPAVLRARRTGRSKMRVLATIRAHLGLIAAAWRGLEPRRTLEDGAVEP